MEDLTFRTDMDFAYGAPAPMGPGVVRVVANNPGPFTFKGTNTYLVGSTELAVIDPGPDDEAHRAAILKAAGERPITHILSTHAHRDHTDGVAALKAATGAVVAAYPRNPDKPEIAAGQSPSGKDFIGYEYQPDIVLKGGEKIEGADWSLLAIHTPGHAPDHLSFALDGRRIVFSGDHVMAWNTTVIAPPEGRMADYIRSLEILLDRQDQVFLPGHGGRLFEPQRTVKAYLLHRRWREKSILRALDSGATTARSMVPVVYQDLPSALMPAATLSILALLEFLIEKGEISAPDTLSPDSELTAVS